jgi:hypothetical protein
MIQKKIVEFVTHDEFNIVVKDVKNCKEDVVDIKLDSKQLW